MQVVTVSLTDGDLFVVGELTETGFIPWNVAPEDAIARINAEWDEHPGPLNPGDIAWFVLREQEQRNR